MKNLSGFLLVQNLKVLPGGSVIIIKKDLNEISQMALIESAWSHYLIIGGSVLGLVWGGVNAVFVSKRIKLNSCHRKLTAVKSRPSSF